MIKIENPADCCGCTACANICHHAAIAMMPDSLGFLYPQIDVSKCIDCGLCNQVCQFNETYDHTLNFAVPRAYAARHKDIDEIMKSRSGAVFVAISDYILNQGGIVYGAGYKDHFRVVHKRATTKEERDEFRGSKYVQSELTDTFVQVKKDLKEGRLVLFTGTPCQTSGLSAFVGRKNRENLILADLVCHGVPSPYIWRDYVRYLEKKEGDVIVKVDFRNKEKFGWHSHKELYSFSKGKEKVCSSYTYLFYKHIMFRRSCSKCHFTNLMRPSDITLADFWGWEEKVPLLNEDDKGVSLVLINTEVGYALWMSVQDEVISFPIEIKDCMQPNLYIPSKEHPSRMDFENLYTSKGLKAVMNCYGDTGWKYKKREHMKRVKSIIKKVLNRK